jgi:hypothetical protein
VSGNGQTGVSPALRERIAALAVTRFRSEDEVHLLEQECFLAHPMPAVSSKFRQSFLSLLPSNLQRTEPISDGPLRVGSRLIATPMFLTRPLVAVEIVVMDEERFGYAYLDGGPFRGRNTVVFAPAPGGTTATVTLRYQLAGLLPAIGWKLLGGARFHRKLIAEAFRTLAGMLAGTQAAADRQGQSGHA